MEINIYEKKNIISLKIAAIAIAKQSEAFHSNLETNILLIHILKYIDSCLRIQIWCLGLATYF